MKKIWEQFKATMPILVVALLMLTSMVTPVFAATSANISVNATPAYVTISNAPVDYGFGVVEVSTNYSTSQAYFTITNGSSVNIDISVGCNATWVGGNDWTHSDTGTPGSTTAALFASADTNLFDIIVKNASPNDLVSALAAVTDQDWELRLMSPTVYDDGVLKTNTVTLTATAS